MGLVALPFFKGAFSLIFGVGPHRQGKVRVCGAHASLSTREGRGHPITPRAPLGRCFFAFA